MRLVCPLFACRASILLTVPSRSCRYSWGALDDEEIEAEERRKHDQKMLDKANGKKKGVLGLAQKLTGRQ